MKMKLTLALTIAILTMIAEGCTTDTIEPNGGGSPTNNRPPVANAGRDKTIILPVNMITLDAAASTDPDNNLSTYNWEKIAGPASFTIANPSVIQTEVTNLVEGVYEFQLTVVDTKGAYAKDTCSVFVVVDRPILSVAGGPIYSLITLPTNSITLSAHGFILPNSVADLVSIQWSKVSGPVSYNISSPASLETLISGLVTGVYVFQFKATDVNGLSDSAQCTVSVIDSSSPNNEVFIPNLPWMDNPVWCSYMDINLDNYIPAGTPVKKIFIKPDCSSTWIEVFLESVITNDDSYDYNIFGNMLYIQWCEGGCSSTDTPDLRIIY